MNYISVFSLKMIKSVPYVTGLFLRIGKCYKKLIFMALLSNPLLRGLRNGHGQYSQTLFDSMWSEHMLRVEKTRVLS